MKILLFHDFFSVTFRCEVREDFCEDPNDYFREPIEFGPQSPSVRQSRLHHKFTPEKEEKSNSVSQAESVKREGWPLIGRIDLTRLGIAM